MRAPDIPPPRTGPPTAAFPAPATSSTSSTNSGVERILRGPSGLGTAALHLVRNENQPTSPAPRTSPDDLPELPESWDPSAAPAEGTPVPGLYYHPVPEPDPARVEEVGRRIKAWALDEVDLYPEDLEDQFDGFSVGRYMVACHPDAPTVEHLMIATRLMVAENAVDDYYCEDLGGSPIGLGERLLLAHTALDPLYTTSEYVPPWTRSLESDAPRRGYRSAMEYFVRAASPSQADRLRHNMARLHMGYLAEGAWAQEGVVPEVWEYLAMRQFNNFRPCPTITDTVGGYELPSELHALPAMQRVIALAGNASTIVNDLYSYTKELASPGLHLNLPVVIAEREGMSVREAYLKAIEVHNELMRDFEAEAAALAAVCPVPSVQRFLRGVAAWVDGNHYWHRTNTYRYSLPDFW
ncbi:family 2 encapsulin nanocompartment cargo protein terpene cyclase [Actinacidiphila acididurans]|uniref:Terpene synthase n=1 Tax=Actinacidiphila acididurans TaxID=2784346 RepID=A0ABS2U4C0_9ACTN|nr:family 2 encapsulin nanocompartment cargo protein terpene cyclase [Actinacidiphila acididurans]MBM9510467.1 2-methylisoborneol synthase [Actinacidiphila acididurans]